MKYRYEVLNDIGEVIDRITVNNWEELIKCIKEIEKMKEEFSKAELRPVVENQTKR